MSIYCYKPYEPQEVILHCEDCSLAGGTNSSGEGAWRWRQGRFIRRLVVRGGILYDSRA